MIKIIAIFLNLLIINAQAAEEKELILGNIADFSKEKALSVEKAAPKEHPFLIDREVPLLRKQKNWKDISSPSLKNLTYVSLAGKNLTEFPSVLTELQELKYLIVSNNQLRALPVQIIQLQHLKMIIADHNLLEEFPLSMLQTPGLKMLDFSFNRLKGFLNQSSSCLVSPPQAPSFIFAIYGNKFLQESANDKSVNAKTIKSLKSLQEKSSTYKRKLENPVNPEFIVSDDSPQDVKEEYQALLSKDLKILANRRGKFSDSLVATILNESRDI